MTASTPNLLFHYLLAFAITSITHLALAVLVYFKGPRKLTTTTYALYALAIGWWTLLEALAVIEPDPVRSLWLWRLCHIAVIFIPIYFVHFVVSLYEIEERPRRMPRVYASYAVGVVFLALNATPLFIEGVQRTPTLPSFTGPGITYPWFILLWAGWALYGIGLMWGQYRRATGLRRIQLRYLCISWLATFIGGAPNFLPVFGVEIPILMPFGTYAVPVNALVTAYAIVRYRAMDIQVVLTRTTVFMTVYALLLGVPLAGAWVWQPQMRQWMGPRWWVWLWIADAILATAAYYVNLYLQRKAEERLLREQRRYQATLLQASQGMAQVRELRRLLKLIVHMITKTVGLTYASVFLEESKADEFRLMGQRFGRRMLPVASLAKSDPLIKLLETDRRPMVWEELRARLEQQVKDERQDLKALAVTVARVQALGGTVVVPSFLQEKLIGFLVLGPKRNGQAFTPEDLVVFSTLANQAAVSIENARFYEGERERQAAIFHAASLSSLGTMASSMGHQVNNRFNVVSVVASTEKLKLKEFLKRNSTDQEEYKRVLKGCLEQFDSLIEEALKGGQVVAAIRRISRPSGEGYKPLRLSEAVQAGLDVAQYKVHFEEIDFTLDVPKDLPQILGDLSQLGEIFLNLVDNAYDAMRMKREQLKPAGYRYTLSIVARQEGEEIVIVVKDNGLGVAEKDRERLFTPFFTTKGGSGKGTGLGLYVIKQVLESHRGSIQLESVYGEGATFTFRIPVAVGALPAAIKGTGP